MQYNLRFQMVTVSSLYITCSLIPLMTALINSSLASGDIPDSMNVARVSPLLKKPSMDSEDLKSYISVSNLSFLSELLERVVAKTLQSYMDTHGLYDPKQSAYRTGHSTDTALTRVQSDLLCTIDKHGVSILVMLDLSAAFDTVDHDVLLDRMHTLLGIDGTVLKWFRSYLTCRTQNIFAVPQGTDPYYSLYAYCRYVTAYTLIVSRCTAM